jgi:large subunit ribosomal protein L22
MMADSKGLKKNKASKKAAPKKAQAAKGKKSPAKRVVSKVDETNQNVETVSKNLKLAGEVARVSLRGFRVSPRKARLVVELVRGKQVEPALQMLMFSPKKTAKVALKLLRSAVANVSESGASDVDKLWVIGGWVNMGKTMSRYMPRAQGRATPIRKRSAHITLVVGQRA